ncbi:Josephin-domain-containing protein [Artomyces pyxidatus]|uniref:Josephin-domain-containing protein n=1 Tax=Artomyces pyxidatus TaxID=48021 RepID=A0ACB8T3T7_9AGAM|nr:Josephin-domain-containing protein [Artomyces pyxidatus]
MAGLENLIPLIYHEKQQAGSMLCAQHALNSLLQGNYFTAPDLSTIAQSLDALEESYDDDRAGRASANMDDTGFFSVQVLENALNVWGLNLVRWRSEAMLSFQDHPHTQLAFILNLHQHWFTLRRFGNALPRIEEDPGDGHWFNLNSFLAQPEWVSKTYLGMTLQQAEAEGYSVFAIAQADPDAPLALTRTDADTLAATLPTPTGATSHLSTTRTPRAPAGLEDEDLELQAALQASLGGGDQTHWGPAQWDGGSSSAAPLDPLPLSFGPPPPLPPASTRPDSAPSTPRAPDDPVAASLARNRAFLERIRREQEFALREQFDENEYPADALRREDDDEMLRRALAESEALAQEDAGADASGGAAVAVAQRVYDDDDAELQAALRASLETVPPGFTLPDTPEHVTRHLPSSSTLPVTSSSQADVRGEGEDEDGDKSSTTETETEAEPSRVEADVTVEEMRRRRLARFGGTGGGT